MGLSERDIKEYYHRYAQKMTNFLVANGSDYATACDMVQSAFVKLWQRRNDFSEENMVSGFLFTVIKNLKIDYARKNKRLIFQDEMVEDGSLCEAHPEQDSREMDYLRKALQEAFEQLPENLRQTYLLFQVSHYSVKQVAQMTGASESLVKVRIHRAKEKLHALLAHREDLLSYLPS